MKINRNSSPITIFILTSLIVTQSIIPADIAQVNPQKLDSYFTRLKRGIKCYWNGTCSKQDKETVQNTATFLVIALAITLKIAWELPWTKEPTVQEFLNLTKDIQAGKVDDVKATIVQLEREGKTVSIESNLSTALKKIAELQKSKRIQLSVKKRIEDSTDEVSASATLTADEKAEIQAGNASLLSQTNKNIATLENKEFELKKTAKLFIDKGFNPHRPIGRLGSLRSQVSTLEIDPKTLQELGLEKLAGK